MLAEWRHVGNEPMQICLTDIDLASIWKSMKIKEDK